MGLSLAQTGSAAPLPTLSLLLVPQPRGPAAPALTAALVCSMQLDSLCAAAGELHALRAPGADLFQVLAKAVQVREYSRYNEPPVRLGQELAKGRGEEIAAFGATACFLYPLQGSSMALFCQLGFSLLACLGHGGHTQERLKEIVWVT